MSENAVVPIPSSDFDLDRFREFLRLAKREVDSWPEWKKNTLGWWRSDEETGVESTSLERWSGTDAEAKAAAMDRVLAAWGMTWEQYKQQPGTDAPDTGREPNVDSEKDRSEPQI